MHSPESRTHSASPSARVVALAAAIALSGWAVYFNALANPFVYDDYRLIVENPTLQPPVNLLGAVTHDISRPLVKLTYALDATVWGIRPVGFHVTSVLIHVLTVLLVFALAWVTSLDAGTEALRRSVAPAAAPGQRQLTTVAALTALFFALHPMLSQAVGYISARADLLCAFFVLLAFLAARRWMTGGRAWWLPVTIAAWLLALASKEPAAMLPFALLAYDRMLLDPAGRGRRLRMLHAPLLVMVAVAIVIRLWLLVRVEYAGGPIDWPLALVALDAPRRYLQLLAWPSGQSVFHALPPIDGVVSVAALVAVGVLALAGLAAWQLRRVSRLVPYGLIWFLLFLVPSGVLFVLGRGEALAEHRVYLPSVGIFLAAGALCGAFFQRLGPELHAVRWLGAALLAIVMLQLGVRTLVRNAVWRSPVGLWEESAAMAPSHWLPQLMLGESQRQRGDCGAAEPHYRSAIRLRADDPFAYNKLGGCLLELRRFDEAGAVFADLQRVAPSSPDGPVGLAITAMMTGHPDVSRQHLEDAIRRDAGTVVARQLLATLVEPGDPRTALRLCREIAQHAPYTPGNAECIQRLERRLQGNGR